MWSTTRRWVWWLVPWNLPLLLLTWKIAPALAAGNTVIAKPSEVTPMTAMLLGEDLSRGGFAPWQ